MIVIFTENSKYRSYAQIYADKSDLTGMIIHLEKTIWQTEKTDRQTDKHKNSARYWNRSWSCLSYYHKVIHVKDIGVIIEFKIEIETVINPSLFHSISLISRGIISSLCSRKRRQGTVTLQFPRIYYIMPWIESIQTTWIAFSHKC